MTEEQTKYENLPAERRADMLADQKSMLFNVALFEHAQRIAKMYASSSMVPQHFRENVGNCFIALNYAHRIGADEFMVMQNMYVVHGRPGLEGKLVIALVNQSRKYRYPGLKYEVRGDINKPGKDTDGIRAYAIDAQTGERVDGPWITWETVKAEGWYDKMGPSKTIKDNKWRTMPEVMFTYRAASWFANKNCPEVKMGMATTEELHDVVNVYETAPGSFEEAEKTEDLEARILAKRMVEETQPKPPVKQTIQPEKFEEVSKKETPPEYPKENTVAIEDMFRESELYQSFNPLNEEVGKRYAQEKKQKLIDMLVADNVDFDPELAGPILHQRLLDHYAAQQEAQAPPDEIEPELIEELAQDTLTEAHRVNIKLAAEWPDEHKEAAKYMDLDPEWAMDYNEKTVAGWNSRISRLVDFKLGQ